jgi:hypothetical protein
LQPPVPGNFARAHSGRELQLGPKFGPSYVVRLGGRQRSPFDFAQGDPEPVEGSKSSLHPIGFRRCAASGREL